MAGESIGDAFVRIRPDTQGFGEETKKTVGGVLAGLATGYAALKVKDFFADSFRGLEVHNKVVAQTASVLKATGNAANVTAKDVESLADALEEKTTIDGDVIQSGENMLLTFKNIRNEAGKGNDIFDQTSKVTLDMAAAMAAASGGTVDMRSAAIQVGKALNDPITGMTALARVGVTFTEQQKEQIVTLAESGDLLGAQKIILKELTSEFGGSAEAQATATGKMQVAYHKLQDTIGEALLPVVEGLVSVLAPAAEYLSEHKTLATALAVVIGGALTAAFVAWTIQVGRSAAATLTSAIRLDLMSESARGAAAGLAGATASAAGIAMLGIAIGQATHKAFDLANAVDNLSRASDRQQAKWFEGYAAILVATKGYSMADAQLKVFRQTAESNVGTAQRLIDNLKAQGQNTDALEKALRREIRAQQQNKHDTEATTDAIEDQTGAMDSLQSKAMDLINAQLGLKGAQLNVQQATENYIKTLADQDASSLDVEQSYLSLQNSIVSYGESVVKESQAAGEVSEVSAQRQVDALSYVAGTLDPGSPLRVWLEGYIDRLRNGIPPGVNTDVTATDNATPVLQSVINKISEIQRQVIVDVTGWIGGSGVPGRAVGGPVSAGQLYQVNEGQGQLEFFRPNTDGRILPLAPGQGGSDGGSISGLVIQGDLIIQSGQELSTLDYWAQTRMAGV